MSLLCGAYLIVSQNKRFYNIFSLWWVKVFDMMHTMTNIDNSVL